MSNNGDPKFIWLVNHSKGNALLNLDGPGTYYYSSTTGNDEGRGVTAAIVVSGEVLTTPSSTVPRSRAYNEGAGRR